MQAAIVEEFGHVQQYDQAAFIFRQTGHAVQSAFLKFMRRRLHIFGRNFEHFRG